MNQSVEYFVDFFFASDLFRFYLMDSICMTFHVASVREREREIDGDVCLCIFIYIQCLSK